MALRISASLGDGFRARKSTAVIIRPGVQKPHCSPCSLENARWIGCISPLFASPSTVTTTAPSAWTASIVHAFVARPSTRTVHAPHWLVSHPTWVPVSASVSRRYSTSSRLGSTSREYVVPLTVTVTTWASRMARLPHMPSPYADERRDTNSPPRKGGVRLVLLL